VGAFIVRRLLGLIPLLLLISFAVFALVLAIPGDPARSIAGGLDADEDRVQEIRDELGLDDGLVEQYGRWLGDVVTGDLGSSLFTGRSVTSELSTRFPVTLSLAVGAVFLAALVGIPLGVLAGTRPGSLLDRALGVSTSFGIALPDFFLGTALVVIFAVELDVLPAIDYVPIEESPVQWARHLIIPWIALGVSASATLARQVRGAMIEVLDQDYIRTARAKGVSERSVIGRHALKNAMTPAVTVIGLQFAYLLGGTFIIEYIFSLPGMGTYMLGAITSKDLPVIQGVVLLIAVIFVFTNLVVDIIYGVLNPKVRVT
jgi:peptide/nickel transport system permease protein